MPHALDVDALVEVLRHEHGLGRGHAELVGGILLQRTGREGRGRVRLGDAALDGCHAVLSRTERRKHGVRLVLAADLALLALYFSSAARKGENFLSTSCNSAVIVQYSSGLNA